MTLWTKETITGDLRDLRQRDKQSLFSFSSQSFPDFFYHTPKLIFLTRACDADMFYSITRWAGNSPCSLKNEFIFFYPGVYANRFVAACI